MQKTRHEKETSGFHGHVPPARKEASKETNQVNNEDNHPLNSGRNETVRASKKTLEKATNKRQHSGRYGLDYLL